MNKINDYGNNIEPQEAEGSLRIHNPTILGKVGQMRRHYWFCVNNDNTLFRILYHSMKFIIIVYCEFGLAADI